MKADYVIICIVHMSAHKYDMWKSFITLCNNQEHIAKMLCVDISAIIVRWKKQCLSWSSSKCSQPKLKLHMVTLKLQQQNLF